MDLKELKCFLFEHFLRQNHAYNIILNSDGDIEKLVNYLNSKLKEQLEEIKYKFNYSTLDWSEIIDKKLKNLK